MAQYVQANTNGRLHPATEPSLSPLNRGFLYGDAIYEVWRTYEHVIFAWERHWRRLENSAAALHLALPAGPDEILDEIRRTCTAFRTATGFGGELYIRLQVSRGAGAIGLDVALADHADFVLLVQPCPLLPAEKLEQGLVLSIAGGLRRNPVESLNPAWKTGNYLNNILCLREARSRGADEVVILNLAGEVAEAAVCNIAFVAGGELVTPPLDAGILVGITRSIVIEEVAPAAGVTVRERAVRPQDFSRFEECLLLSSTRDIAPVSAIDAARFRTGPGTVARKLKEHFASYARAEAGSRSDLKV